MQKINQPPDTGGINATSSASEKTVCSSAYSQLRASRTFFLWSASAGNFPISIFQNCSQFKGDGGANSIDSQPVASLSWAKNKTRMTNERSTGRFQQQLSAG